MLHRFPSSFSEQAKKTSEENNNYFEIRLERLIICTVLLLVKL